MGKECYDDLSEEKRVGVVDVENKEKRGKESTVITFHHFKQLGVATIKQKKKESNQQFLNHAN